MKMEKKMEKKTEKKSSNKKNATYAAGTVSDGRQTELGKNFSVSGSFLQVLDEDLFKEEP
jgi:hypothetical protein